MFGSLLMDRVKEGTAKGVLAMSLDGWTQAFQRKTEQFAFPEFPAPGIRRFTFEAGGTHGWKISAIQTIRSKPVGSSRVDLQACKLEYSIVSPK